MDLTGFTPTTPTELALINEIRRLQRTEALLNLKYAAPITEPVAINTLAPVTELRLLPAAELIANLDEGGNIVVRVTSGRGTNRMGLQHMMERAVVERMPKAVRGDYMAMLHRDVLENLARLISR